MALKPIDPEKCQAEILEGSFMTFGRRRYSRCPNKPTWIAVEIKTDTGFMALCDTCKKVFEIYVSNVAFQRLKEE